MLNNQLKFGYVQENAYLCSVERDNKGKGETLEFILLHNLIIFVNRIKNKATNLIVFGMLLCAYYCNFLIRSFKLSLNIKFL